MENIIDYGMKYQYEYCIHLADIHIRNEDGNIDSRFDEYGIVFNNLMNNIKKKKIAKKKTLIVIAGDIFHDARKEKGRTTANAVLLFKNFIQSLLKCGTIVIIPGNHDNNITFQSKSDNMIDTLSSIFQDIKGLNQNIFYLKDTGIYKIGNCFLYTTSVFDLDCIKGNENYIQRKDFLPKRIKTDIKDDFKHICLIHCGVQSQKLSNGHLLKDYDYSIEDLINYDITMLGDTHEQQFLGNQNNIAYPSSLIQQNYGESINKHGYILWNLNTKKGEFYNINNDYGFISLNFIDTIISNFDIENIIFPKKSRIMIKHNEINDNFLINIRDKIKNKTEIIEWKIRKQLISNKKKTDNIENINNSSMFMKYLDTKYIPESKENVFIRNKIKNTLSKNTYFGNNIWNLRTLIVNNFQNYKGGHELLNFEDIDENKIISILGENASGKSTIGRALSYVIWGKEIYNIDTYVNNESNNMICKLKFMYNNKKYEINRQYNKKSCKEFLQFYIYQDDEKIEITESHKTHTQEKIINIFGRREDAKTTWLCEQNSSADFLNNNNNVDIFTKIVGIDHFLEEYHITIKEKNNLLKESSSIQKDISLLNQNFDNNLSGNINLLENDLESIKKNELEMIDKINKENGKKKFGTMNEYLEWNQLIQETDLKLFDIKNINNGITQEVYNKQNNDLRDFLEKLQTKKNELLIQIQKIDKTYLDHESIQEMENQMTKYNIQDKITCREFYESTLLEIAILENNITQNDKNQNILDEIQKKLQRIYLNDDVDYNNILNEIQENIKQIEKQIEINQEITKNFSISNYKERFEELKILQTNLISEEKDKKEIQNKILSIHNNLFNIDINQETLENKLFNIKNTEKKLDKKKKELDKIIDIIKYKRENLDKYKHLQFDNHCSCCQNNRNHFQISIIEEDIEHFEKEKAVINNKIDSYQKYIHQNIFYKEIQKQIDSNLENENQINIFEKQVEILRKSIEFQKEKITIIQQDNIDSQLKMDKKGLIETLLIKKNGLIQRLDEAQGIYEKIEKDTKMKQNIENEMEIISKQILEKDIIDIKKQKIITMKDKIDYYNLSSKVREYYKIEKTKKENCDIQEKIIQIDFENNNITKSIVELNKKYNLQRDRDMNERCLIETKDILNEKITNFKNYDQCLIEKSQSSLIDIKRNLLEKSNQLYYYKEKMKEYQQNQLQISTMNEGNKKVLQDVYLLEQYIKILDPVKGYPKNLMDNNLQILTEKVNQFIEFAGFQYITEFKCPEIKEGSKNKKNKILITHTKNNKYFSKLSGAEEFTFNLATLTALGQMSNISNSPILFIDEGFSSLDQNHLNQIEQILNHLKTQFKYVLNISHISSIHRYADIRIRIKDKRLIIENNQIL